MTRTTQVLKRLGVAGIAIATIGAGVPALLASGAQAATTPTANLTITPNAQTGAAGTCLKYVVTATDASGGNTNGTPTVTITITQNPGQPLTATTPQNISFCDPSTAAAPNTSTPSNNGSVANPGSQSMDFQTQQTSSTSPATATFGVRSDQPGGIAIRATTGSATAGTQVTSAQATATYTAGGNNAVTKLQDVSTAAQQQGGFAGGTQSFAIKALDAAGNPVPGVTVSFQVQSGGANGAAAGTAPANNTCSAPTDNTGVANCSYGVSKSGTDTFLFFVNQTTGTGQQTSGPDQGEPQLTVSRTTAPTPNTNAAAARNITITPSSTTTAAGASRTFTVTVTDVKGTAVQGATVVGTLSGPGRFTGTTRTQDNNTTFDLETTNGFGQATFTTTTFSTESGTQVLTARLSGSSDCTSAAGSPAGSTDGNCNAVASNVIGAASPSPSASSSSSPSPSSSTAPAGRQTLGLTIDTPTIEAGNQATLTVTGSANQDIQLECYTRPSTTFAPSHATTIDAAGDAKVFKLSLGMNTRCFAEYVKNPGSGFSNQGVVNVRTVVSIFPVRNGFRDYTFQGHNLPKYAGQLITLYYESKNGTTRKGNVKTDATGIYHIPAKFVGSGIFTFYVRTGQTLTNAAGESDHVSVSIH